MKITLIKANKGAWFFNLPTVRIRKGSIDLFWFNRNIWLTHSGYGTPKFN